MDGKRIWHQRGWDIFFTFGLDASEKAFVYKIDCQLMRDSNLSGEQIELFKQLIPTDLSWNEISCDELLLMNWGSLS